MNAQPLPPAGRTQAAPLFHWRTLPALALGCTALILTALAAPPYPSAAAEPPAHGGAQPAKGNKATKAKPGAEATKSKTTQAAKRQPRKTSVGQAANPLPAAALALGADQGASAARAAAFESGPGVLGVSLRTARQQQIKEYVTEPVALVALAFDDLRFAPVNKGDHVAVNLADRIQFDGKGDKVAAKSRRVLDVIARILTDNPGTRVQVLVHTDDAADAAANLRQSQKGAEAVRQYLMSKGVQAERITANGRGAEVPLSNKRADRFRNKRVELQVAPLTPPPAPPGPAGSPPDSRAPAAATPGAPVQSAPTAAPATAVLTMPAAGTRPAAATTPAASPP